MIFFFLFLGALIFVVFYFLRFCKIIKLFKQGNVSVDGLRGCGKDMLISNVIARRKKPYISNVDYNCKGSRYIPLEIGLLDIQNTYDNFISGNVVPYQYPYPEGVDFYLSDGGVYLPSQYERELVKKYPSLPYFMALSRHIGDCNFHFNVQNLNRMWDKFREQSDTYIKCNWCKVFFGKLVVQKITIYDKYQSCIDRVKPYKRIKAPLLSNSSARATTLQTNALLKNKYDNEYGFVQSRLLIYRNKSKYDTRLFKSLLSEVKSNDEVEELQDK